jgi:hypothetical protein
VENAPASTAASPIPNAAWPTPIAARAPGEDPFVADVDDDEFDDDDDDEFEYTLSELISNCRQRVRLTVWLKNPHKPRRSCSRQAHMSYNTSCHRSTPRIPL